MSEPVGHEEIRAETVMQAARTMAGAAMTAPKSGGMLFLKGSPVFLETVIVDDSQTRKRLADWMRARGKERRETIWFRDAEVAEAVDAVALQGDVSIEPAATRRNVLTRGIDVNNLVGKRFRIGDVECEGVELCEPCGHLESMTQPGVIKALVHRGGLNADILSDGEITVGDPVVAV